MYVHVAKGVFQVTVWNRAKYPRLRCRQEDAPATGAGSSVEGDRARALDELNDWALRTQYSEHPTPVVSCQNRLTSVTMKTLRGWGRDKPSLLLLLSFFLGFTGRDFV